MSFVIVFGLGISSLIVDAVRVETNVIEAGKAYFAAEGGIEETLYFQENELPGYEAVVEESAPTELENGATLIYEMFAVGEEVPCDHRSSDWRTLGPMESISLPVFKAGESGRVDIVTFEVEYYVEDGAGGKVSVDDSLRWKILGLDKNDDYRTEAVSGLLNFSESAIGANNEGEILNSDDLGNHYDLSGATQTYYTGDMGYAISTFLEDHILNYLILTNFASDDMQVKLITAEEAVCEYTLTEADGFSGGTKQSIDVQVKLDSFLPVFDFVLYQTSDD